MTNETQTEPARKRFAQVVDFLIRDRKLTADYVARRCRVSVHELDRWRNGASVPGPNEWEQLRRKVCHEFGTYNELWRQARTELDAERKLASAALQRSHVVTDNGVSKSAVTNLGEKIRAAVEPAISAAAITPPVPEAMIRVDPRSATAQLAVRDPVRHTRDGRILQPERPDGSMSADSRAQRRQFAKGILLQRPSIPAVGYDGLVKLVRDRFGVGIDPGTVRELRSEISFEAREKLLRSEVGIATPADAVGHAVQASVASEPAVASEPVRTDELSTAIELVMSAVPGLQSLTLTIDEHGEATVDYKVREVKVQTTDGSIKVRR